MINGKYDMRTWLKVECAKAGITQAELSRRINRDPVMVTRSITNNAFRVSYLEDIANALDKHLVIKLVDNIDKYMDD